MRYVVGCPCEGPGLRVRAEWREVMLCYVMLYEILYGEAVIGTTEASVIKNFINRL